MTIKEFMIALKELSEKNERKFQFVLGEYMRVSSGDSKKTYCPITFVCHEVTGEFISTCEWYKAAQLIHLSKKTAEKIAAAADRSPNSKKATRKSLLMALGLKEMGKK